MIASHSPLSAAMSVFENGRIDKGGIDAERHDPLVLRERNALTNPAVGAKSALRDQAGPVRRSRIFRDLWTRGRPARRGKADAGTGIRQGWKTHRRRSDLSSPCGSFCRPRTKRMGDRIIPPTPSERAAIPGVVPVWMYSRISGVNLAIREGSIPSALNLEATLPFRTAGAGRSPPAAEAVWSTQRNRSVSSYFWHH